MSGGLLISVRMVGLAGLAALSLSCAAAERATLKGDLSQVAAFDCPSALAVARRSEEPAPLLVLLETNPWGMVVGSDSPTFALYEDGTAIYRTASGHESAKLEPDEKKRFLESLELGRLSGLGGGYRATEATDQPRNFLLVYGEKPVFIYVYGSMDLDSVTARLPPGITSVRNRLRAFANDRAVQWLPDYVEVMIWPYDYAPEPSILWPKRWPGLKASNTRKRDQDSFSIFIPSAELEQLKAFLAGRRPKGAIEIDGKKWAASLRLPFPHERLWMAPDGC